MDGVKEVQVGAVPVARLAPLLVEGRAEVLADQAIQISRRLAERTVWNVSSTSRGGGVAEMLQTMLAYGRGAGVDTRWLVIDGTPAFFATTKRLHNLLHGSAGDGGSLGHAERTVYVEVLARALEQLRAVVRSGDVVVLHDPQTAGLVDGVRAIGAHVVWRCHIGRDERNELTEAGWSFLREFVGGAEAFVFSRKEFTPSWVPSGRLFVIPPSLDPFSAKNAPLDDDEVAATLGMAGLVDTGGKRPSAVSFGHRDGSRGTLRAHSGLLLEGSPVPAYARTVLQVSRWDRLKDMAGVLSGFAEHVESIPDDVHLILAGPDVDGVGDDPEGAQVLDECQALWRSLEGRLRARVHLCCLPMDDVDENALLVNALQRHATVVVQKSIEEGFGLTVTEPMWKARPLVATAVGGIKDQIVDGVSGRLLQDPHDHAEFLTVLSEMLTDVPYAEGLGRAAKERVRDVFLVDRHLLQYAALFSSFVSE
jgi:trehalose synthase